MKRFSPVFLGILAVVAPLFTTDAAITYRPGDSFNAEAEDMDPGPLERDPLAQMQKAEAFEREEQPGRALNAYRQFLAAYPRSLLAPRAQIKVAELYEQIGEYERAYKEYGKYITRYKRGPDFEKAVEAQYEIARLFLDGERIKFLGVRIFPATDAAKKMFEDIVKVAPYSKVAPRAQFSVGLALEKQGKRDKAIEVYQEMLVKYQDDPIAADAQYQIGYVYFREARSGSYDPKASVRARDAFEDFIARYPDSEKVPQAKENIALLAGKRTSGSLKIAQFYEKQKNYKAAVIYYNEVIRLDPDSEQSKIAKARIEELRQKYGDDRLRIGPERAGTGESAARRRKFAAEVDTVSRPDYVGPRIVVPEETPRSRPQLRTTPEDVGPIPAVEPPLPAE
jgi:outer membrane protein assembly factor BamD